MDHGKRHELERLIADFDIAMLVTFSLAGAPRGRPMAIAGTGGEGELYFTTRSEDEKLSEILQSPDVAVTLQAEDRYVSLTGKARLETDVQLAEELWSPAMKVWFPDGFEGSQFTVIRVDPVYAEFWDRRGLRKLEYLWEAGKALATGRKAKDAELGGHAKLRAAEDDERD
jgi:general stress protein 26